MAFIFKSFALALLLPFHDCFTIESVTCPLKRIGVGQCAMKATSDPEGAIQPTDQSRRLLMELAGSFLLLQPVAAWADVADGNSLPEGAAQFNRVVRLKSDLKGVAKRVRENAADIDKKEWDNIGKFLRTAYSTGEDMKAVASGVFNPDSKKRALEDVALLRKYAQAGDVAVNKQDPEGFLAVAEKMSGLIDDFFDSLSDVPDEL